VFRRAVFHLEKSVVLYRPNRRGFWSPSILTGNKNHSCQLSTQNVTNHGGQMPDKKQDLIDQKLQDLNNDGVDRRGFLKCMAWAGTGLVWTLSGGIPYLEHSPKAAAKVAAEPGTSALSRSATVISASTSQLIRTSPPLCKRRSTKSMPCPTTGFHYHTGDLSQLSKPSEFDTLDQALKGASAKQIYFVPGEHDMLSDDGDQYLQRYGKGTKGSGWYSFDHRVCISWVW